jgi:large conductance mechanosensitive channel
MKLSALWAEFKAFAFKGNMIDLAIAVVIGAAFSGVINSLVKDIIMPSITYVTSAASSATKAATDAAHTASSNLGLTNQPSTQPATEGGAAQAAAPPPPPPPPPPAPAKPADDKPVDFTWTIGRIRIGNFIGELINFLLVAFAVFMLMVKLLGGMMKRVSGPTEPSEPTTKECPFCLSVIPYKARKCAHCTADMPAGDAPSA